MIPLILSRSLRSFNMHYVSMLYTASCILFILGCMNAVIACPDRDLDRLEDGRQCKRRCNTDSDCKGYRKKCICDDFCGMSCINPNITCRFPKEIENGDIVGSEQMYKSSLSYNCHEGFILNGNRRRTCRSDRKWSGTSPTCHVQCRAPRSSGSSFPDATKNLYTVGEELPYLCRFGYDLSGIAVATCMPDGTWELSDFQCIPKNCGDPGTIRNGYISSGDEYTFGNRVQFSCNRGYELEGTGRLSCNTEGKWQPSTRPTCTILECGVPIAPEHGSVDTRQIDAFVYLARVSYSCEPGYKLVGNSFGICNENQTWGELPTCEVIGCDVPTPPEEGYLSPHQSQVPIGAEITYQCYDGYTIYGEATLQCRSDETWSAEVPQCVDQVCTRASIPSDVHIQPSKSNWIPGDKVTYSCKKDNYELIGTPTATCQSSGQWSNSDVRCQALLGLLACPTGYVWDSPYCFKFFERPATFNDAEEICESEAATLPVILDKGVQDKIHNLVTNAGNKDSYWVGLSDSKEEGTFGWVNGAGTRYHYNALYGRSNSHQKDCVTARTVFMSSRGNTYTWEAQHCDTRWKFVCMMFDELVIPFTFNGPNSYFNGLYIAEYGKLWKGRSFYYRNRPWKPNAQAYVYSNQENHWGVYAQGYRRSTYQAAFPTKTPLQVGSAWRYSRNPEVQASLALTIYSRWEEWGNWGSCSLSCGTGYQERRRRCLQPTIEWAYCKGSEKSIMKCNEFDCPFVDDPCLPNPCRNGGSCQQDGQNYTCTCGREWGGDRCTQYDPCKQKPCRNNGICSVVDNSYSCTCTQRWSGRTCTKARNICFFDESLVSSDVVIEGISGEVHEPGSVFQVGCREPGQQLNAVISTMTCQNGGVWAPDYTQFQCS